MEKQGKSGFITSRVRIGYPHEWLLEILRFYQFVMKDF